MNHHIPFADRQRFERALESYLHSCFARRSAARVSEFAQSLGVSRSYLARVFPSVLGQTVHEALRARQLEQAELLLRSTALSTRDVATAAGCGHQIPVCRVSLAC